MCGRFSLAYPWSSLIAWYNAVSMPDTAPRYNIAPFSDILTIRNTSEGRQGSMMRWGLVPSWVKDIKKLRPIINARAETLTSKPMFRHAFRKQRCLIPASGFYEWQVLPDGKHKQPFYISSKDGNPLSFAGLWEKVTLNEFTIETCTIITTDCNALLHPIHDRMPAILPHEAWDPWLSPDDVPDDELTSLLKPLDTEKMQLWPVSTAVNKTTNQGKQLIFSVNQNRQFV